MLFQESGDVPFWVNPQEHVATNSSHYDYPQLKYKTKAQLLGNIKSSGVDIYVVKDKKVGELQDIPLKNQISVTKRIRNKRIKVQMGNQNEHLQVLWERLFMETPKEICTYYKLRLREDNYGKKILETILRGIMRNCLNFIEEQTQIQTNACNMGQCRDHIIINFNPKCHPELSGEDIE